MNQQAEKRVWIQPIDIMHCACITCEVCNKILKEGRVIILILTAGEISGCVSEGINHCSSATPTNVPRIFPTMEQAQKFMQNDGERKLETIERHIQAVDIKEVFAELELPYEKVKRSLTFYATLSRQRGDVPIKWN